MGIFDDVLAPAPVETKESNQSPAPPIRGTFDDVLTPPPAAPPEPQGKVVYRSSIFPLSRTDQGKVIWDWGSGITGDIGRGFTLAGRVASGETPMPQLGTRDPAAYNTIAPEALNMATMFGPKNPAILSGEKVIPGEATNLYRPVRPAPTTAELFDVGGRQMDQFRDLPIRYNPAHMGTMADAIENRLIDKGIFQDDAKGIYATLARMRESAQPQESGATVVIAPASLHSLRRNIQNKFGVQGENQLAPQIALDELDKFIKTPPAGAVMVGPTAATPAVTSGPALDPGTLFSQARGNLAAGYRGEGIEDLTKRIDLRTAAAHSGRNLDNTTRQQIASLVLDDKKTRGFTQLEKDALENAVYGDRTTNALRSTSKMLGGGGGLGATLSGSLGFGVGGAVGTALGVPSWVAYPAGAVIPPVVGERLAAWGAARTQKALQDVADQTRMRSPLFQSQPLLPMQAPTAPGRDAIARTLMMTTTPPSPDRLYVSPLLEEKS